MTSEAASVEVFTPRPRDNPISIHEQLLVSLSSTDSSAPNSTEMAPTPLRQKHRDQRSHVQFATPKLVSTSSRERIKVDEVDDAPKRDEMPSLSARSRSRSILRNVSGPRAASRPPRRRAFSRAGIPISRDTVFDQPDDPSMTPEEIAREIRPETFIRFKRISPSESSDKASFDKHSPAASTELRDFNFEKEAKAVTEIILRNRSPGSLSLGEEMDPDALSPIDFQKVELPETEELDSTIAPGQQEEED